VWWGCFILVKLKIGRMEVFDCGCDEVGMGGLILDEFGVVRELVMVLIYTREGRGSCSETLLRCIVWFVTMCEFCRRWAEAFWAMGCSVALNSS
jgi:hypothetical protein